MTTRTALLMFAICVAATTAAFAIPDPPGPATVHVLRSPTILIPQGISAPRVLYPQGRVDYDVVEKLVDAAVAAVTGKPAVVAWGELFESNDRVGILIDTNGYAVQTATVETVVDRLINTGISPGNIIVFSGDEGDLFMAGFNINRDEKSVRVLGTESEGFRGGFSRIVSDYCDAIINIAALEVDPEIGFTGCVANALACVPTVRRVELRGNADRIGSVAAMPVFRQRLRLNLLEAYLPLLDTVGQGKEKQKITWQYGGLIAGTDPVAVDVVGRQILEGCRQTSKGQPWPLPQATDYLQPAQLKYRLGMSARQQITVKVEGHTQDAFTD